MSVRIAELQLRNFGSLREAHFDLAEITLIAGHNNSGKSTTADAIEWVLTGRTRGTDGRGAGVDRVLFFSEGVESSDQMKAGVRVYHNGEDVEIVRAIRGSSSTILINKSAGQLAVQQARICEIFGGVPLAVLSALCNTRAFLDLAHAEAKDMLLKVLDVRVPVGKGTTVTIEQLDTYYQQAFDSRRAAKLALAQIRVPERPKEEAPDPDAIEEALVALRDELTAALVSGAKDDGRRGVLEADLARAEADIARLDQALAKAPDLSASIAEIEATLAALVAPVSEAVEQAKSSLAVVNGRLPVLEDVVARIGAHDPTGGCVIDGQIPCKTPATKFAAHSARLTEERDRLLAEKASLEARLEASVEFERSKAISEVQLRDAKAKQEARQSLIGRRDEAVATRDRLFDEIAQLPAIVQEPPEVTELRQRVSRGEETLREARRLVEAWRAYKDASEAQSDASKRVAGLEAQVERFGPKGIRVEALQRAIGTFEARINQPLGMFGYELKFRLDPWDVMVNGRSAVRLSESERLRVGVSLQLALADITGVGFAVIDGVDVLLPDVRDLLFEMLDSWQGQAIVTCSRTEAPEVPEGVFSYWLTLGADGATTVERMHQAVRA